MSAFVQLLRSAENGFGYTQQLAGNSYQGVLTTLMQI